MQTKIYTLELFQYNTDKRKKARVHVGTVRENLDGLSPCALWTREYYADNKKHAEKKARAVCKEYNYQFVR